ncbi:hypothetical protein PM082_021918 [Marasmius tenuissimus]|nr:hypothetical protein PM082_021918 [Marasmius tenuissimus]
MCDVEGGEENNKRVLRLTKKFRLPWSFALPNMKAPQRLRSSERDEGTGGHA